VHSENDSLVKSSKHDENALSILRLCDGTFKSYHFQGCSSAVRARLLKITPNYSPFDERSSEKVARRQCWFQVYKKVVFLWSGFHGQFESSRQDVLKDAKQFNHSRLNRYVVGSNERPIHSQFSDFLKDILCHITSNVACRQ
jgi:hypothetical protein